MNEHEFSQRALDLKKGDISVLCLELMEKAQLEAAAEELAKAARAADEAMWNHVHRNEDKELREAQEALSEALVKYEKVTK